MKLKFFSIVLTTLLLASLTGASNVQADDCAKANALYKQSLSSESGKEGLLEKAIGLCPQHTGALNNLALLKEDQGRMVEAERYYKRAIESAPNNIASYAGLGDVLMAQNNFQEAEGAYRTFVEGLVTEKEKGDPLGLAAYEEEYRVRWNKARASVLNDQNNVAVVSAKHILRSLSKPRLRGLKVEGRTKPSIDISILFDTNSYRINPKSLAQIDQIAKALKGAELQETRILIEGHTDNVGEETYNLALSQKRAETIKQTLVARFGIQPDQMETKGFGETLPIAPNDTETERALNRRVTFVNQGRM
jgi:outer membrane protein OmpA-like peptidoglycan-associated protein